MDELVRREAENLQPNVAFRATTGHRHATWAGTWHSRPELYVQPRSVAEVQKAVDVARRCGRHVVVVGSGHSPSDLTCTSGWKMNLDGLDRVLSVVSEDEGGGGGGAVVVMQAGIRLWQLQEALRPHGLAMPNAGSITDQSFAGAIATGTHGSSLRHGLLSDNVLALKLVLADGSVRSCSRTEDEELFRAALVSLGALGIVVEVTFRAVPDFKVQWTQKLEDLSYVLDRWDKGLWTDHEFVRVWWMPYMRKCIHWRADKTDVPVPEPPPPTARRKITAFLGRLFGFHFYQLALYVANWIPSITPWIERLVGRIQYGSSSGGAGETAVQWSRDGLQMDCLYSQFVNEWAIPLERGPEALRRLSAWINGDVDAAAIPFSPRGIYVHAPIEVRVSDGSRNSSSINSDPKGPRAFLDPTSPDGPTLYLNATLYRPYHTDPPATRVYYQAFEFLMRQLGGRPHWAKNFTHSDLAPMYPDLDRWLGVRDEVDPQGMFAGDWHRRNLLDGRRNNSKNKTMKEGAAPLSTTTITTATTPLMPLEERLWSSSSNIARGGRNYLGEVAATRTTSPSASVQSFEMMDHHDAEMSVMLDSKFVGDE